MKFQDFFLDYISAVEKNKYLTEDESKDSIVHQITIDHENDVHAAMIYSGHGETQTGKLYPNHLLIIYDGEMRAMDLSGVFYDGIWLTIGDMAMISEYIDMLNAYGKPLDNTMELKTSHDYGEGYVCFMGSRWSGDVELGFKVDKFRANQNYTSLELQTSKFIEFFDGADILIHSEVVV